MFLIRTSIPADPLAGAADVTNHSKRIALALNMLPFAGISFLWFVGVLRDRVGKLEDRFFGTVFLGSALLFLGMIFAAGAVAAGIIRLLGSGSLMGPGVYALGRIGIYQAMHLYAIRMAGVFMISTSTILLRTGIVPRWMAFLGFALALTLTLLSSNGTINGILLVFPLWVLSISVHILIDNSQGRPETAAGSSTE